jgi:6,7-dimethyl-8-ribityllumazine synthase
MLTLIKLKVIQINYYQALKTLGDIINGKTAYDQVVTNNVQEILTDTSKENILNLTADKKFKVNAFHTAILMDDAINTF